MGGHHKVTLMLQQYCNELGLVSFNIVCSKTNHRLSWSSRPSAGELSVLLVQKNRIYPQWKRPFDVELCEKKKQQQKQKPICIQKELLEKCAVQVKRKKNENFIVNLLIVLVGKTSCKQPQGHIIQTLQLY